MVGVSLQFGSNSFYPKFLNETRPRKPAPPPLATTRHPTKKFSSLFLICARRISFSPNEKSIFLWCLAMNCKVAGLASFLLSKRKAEFPPNPPSAFLLLKRNENGSRRAKIPSPQPPSFLPADCLPASGGGFAPKTFGRTGFLTY